MTKKVAVIGCGPSGMFFLHSIAIRRKRLEQEGNMEGLAALPEVTCFEKSLSPGGLWKIDRINDRNDDDEKQSGNMYEAMWTNGPKESFEFFDYTFDEHFGCAMPMFMPRQLILEYMLARCTKNNPNIFDNVKFNTSVRSVNFSEDLGKFVVQTADQETESVTESMFDKCIWAAGANGRPKIPQTISKVLMAGGFKGRIMHSSKTGTDFDQCVRGRKILIIGDSYSAEDLTLIAIKLGVKSVDICSRSGGGIASGTGSWPAVKVIVHYSYIPTGVTSDGFGVVLTSDKTKGTEEMILDDISTVIYCTGYLENMDMLHPTLQPANEEPYIADYDIPKDWEMPHNALSEEFGDIPLGKMLYSDSGYVRQGVYRGQLMSNPNMMFFFERFDVPLLDIDVTAWLLLAQITGDLLLPSFTEMKQFNLDSLLHAVKNPSTREECDENYKKRWGLVDDHHWSYDYSDERVVHMSKNYCDLQCRILARDMVDSKYPLQIGTYDKLNEEGKAMVEFDHASSLARYDLDEKSANASWRTFRDCNPSKCYSIRTGTKAVPLKCRWLYLDGESVEDIVDDMVKVE